MNEQTMKRLNLAFRFILEMLVLVSVFLFGMSLSEELLIGLVFGIVGLALVMTVWGLFVAPKASRRLPDPTRLAVELVVWFLGVLTMGFAVSWILAIMFGVAVMISLGLMLYWGQRAH